MEIKKENMEWLAEAMHYVKSKVNENLPKYSTVFPTSSSENLIYGEMGNKDWTEGFWTGILWLLYEDTNEEKYLSALETLLRTFQERLDQNIDLNTHDIGFLYSLSTLAGYKITGNEKALELSVRAADCLMERYSEKAQIIQAWGNLEDPKEKGRMIIDCLMNLSLLYNISEITGEKKYKEAAEHHAKQAQKYLVREDYSTYHTYYMNVDTGEPIKGVTAQGYSDNSAWREDRHGAFMDLRSAMHIRGTRHFWKPLLGSQIIILRDCQKILSHIGIYIFRRGMNTEIALQQEFLHVGFWN